MHARPQTADRRPQTADRPALTIVRRLPAADQRDRELVLGKVVFAPGAPGIARPAAPKSRARPGAPARQTPPALVQLNRRVVELSLERAGIESALAAVRRRIEHLLAEADRLEALLAGITLGEAASLGAEERAAVDRVLLVVAKELRVPIAAVLGRRGIENVCWARFIALTLAGERASVGGSRLARYLGRQHTDVFHAFERCRALRESCPAFRAQWERCVAKLEEES